jgi:hypothetical protein
MNKFTTLQRAILTLVAPAAVAGLGVAHAQQNATMTIQSDGSQYSCTLGSLNVSGAGSVTASVTACTPALGSGGAGGGATQPAGPVTVTPLTTTSSTPTISGSVTLATGETFTVAIGARTYSVGDGNLTQTGSSWTLVVPAANALGVGTYNVTARIANAQGGALIDSTVGELVIQSVPGLPGADGGYGSGLWQPAGMANVFVADQSGVDGSGTASIVPGCINGGSADYYAACRSLAAYTGTINGQEVSVRLTQGQILSLRYRVNTAAATGAATGAFQLSNLAGANIGYQTTMSLSSTPGDFSNPKCVITDTRRPSVRTGSDYCAIDRSKGIYYLNIRVNVACSACVFTVGENSSELY